MKLKNIFLAIAVLASAGATLEAQTTSEVAEQKKNLNLWRLEINKSKDLPNENAIPLLGRCVVKMTDRGIYQIEERWEVYREAQAALLAIPGHAEYYRDQIVKAISVRDAAVGKLEYSGKAGDFRTVLHSSLSTLENLPSPESVRVLGDLLSDHSANPFPVQDGMMEAPLSRTAVRYLARFPLVSKPANTIHDSEAERDLPAWQHWYEQIKAGNRTFRFEGDPIEYDLNGPAPKDKLVRIERDQKRDAERLVGNKKPTPGSEAKSPITQISKPTTIAGILAAFALCAAAVWYFLKSRKVA